jgi:hypothetical protein
VSKGKTVTAIEFVTIWNRAESEADAAQALGLSIHQCRQRKAAYAKRNVKLVDHPVVRQTAAGVEARWSAVQQAAEAALKDRAKGGAE